MALDLAKKFDSR